METDRNRLDHLHAAVRHLTVIDAATPPNMVRLHSHFSLIFLQLYLENDASSTTVTDGDEGAVST